LLALEPALLTIEAALLAGLAALGDAQLLLAARLSLLLSWALALNAHLPALASAEDNQHRSVVDAARLTLGLDLLTFADAKVALLFIDQQVIVAGQFGRIDGNRSWWPTKWGRFISSATDKRSGTSSRMNRRSSRPINNRSNSRTVSSGESLRSHLRLRQVKLSKPEPGPKRGAAFFRRRGVGQPLCWVAGRRWLLATSKPRGARGEGERSCRQNQIRSSREGGAS
jgi:hypothetical protein